MIEMVSKSDIEELISELLDINLTLIDGNYLAQKLDRIIQYTYTTLEPSQFIFEKTNYAGLPIFHISRGKILLYPVIMKFIFNFRHKTVTYDKIKKISHGKSIHIMSDDGIFLIKDKQGRQISFGKILSNQYFPLVDLGMYLRDEKKW